MWIPGTECAEYPSGVMVQVFWEQEESGALRISGHSLETPIPPNVEVTPSRMDHLADPAVPNRFMEYSDSSWPTQ